MIQVNQLLGRLFPWMALSGLLLAGWGLLITPDDMKGDPQAAWGAKAPALSLSEMASSTP
jgi:hypothetical protein